MREIEFRAWNGKEMVYDFAVINGKVFVEENPKTSNCINIDIDGKKGSFYDDWATYNHKAWELMQYTGLKDKNGVKIFEGDIISCTLSFEGRTLPHIGVVIYSDNIACFCTKNDAGDTPMLKHCTNTRLIVGNIYENPELMEA